MSRIARRSDPPLDGPAGPAFDGTSGLSRAARAAVIETGPRRVPEARTASVPIVSGDDYGIIILPQGRDAGDLLVVDGDPSTEISVLRDRSRIRAILHGGRFVKDTP